MAADFDEHFEDPDDDRPAPVRPVGTRDPPAKKGMSGWAIAGIVVLCTVVPLGCVIGLLVPAVSSPRDAVRSLESQNNVKMQSLAVTNYATFAGGVFPPHGEADADPDAPPVAWMTAMLPFMDQRAVHRSIDFTQPFDAPENATAFSHVVNSYTSPDAASDTLPGGLAAAHYAGNAEVFVPGLTLDQVSMADGVTNTLMIGEVNAAAGAPAAWGDPANLRSASAPLNGPTGFGANGSGGIVVAFADGRATRISPEIDPTVLKALGTPNGGERVSPGDW